ncbi:MAG: hypothetical protein HRT40_11970, partial [Campylobacteraceae bacterium]|nr:hypothetical protein [Campylobacteraceae bacterium]
DIPPFAPLTPDSPALIPIEVEEDVVLLISLREMIFKSPFIFKSLFKFKLFPTLNYAIRVPEIIVLFLY